MGLKNRFLGICISRKLEGLHSQFTLRNVIEGIGVEVMYEMYTPTITKIEVIKLEKRLDDDLTFLIDAYPEYSTFDMNMEPTPHIPGKPVPVNPIKVKLQPPPWTRRWELFDYKGIEDCWTEQTSYFKRKLSKSKLTDLRKYDLIADYREVATNVDEELAIEQEMLDFETKKLQAGVTKRKILRCAEQSLSQDLTDLRKYDLIADYREVATNVDEELAIEQEMLDFETKKLQAGVTKRRILRCAEQSLSQDV
ncbi:unnamed protein product [Gongylonema pulchrum]|uniref:Large ribosomal subunit protein bL19m n=1 Tax=Gongylonema pulchrum TaxID=637853 RepID=A0A183ENT7_9BILA|nr:unnamed protein product [Gongylonema pulchrum]